MPARFINVSGTGRARFINVTGTGRANFSGGGGGGTTTTTTTTAPPCYCYRATITGTMILQYTACVSGNLTTIDPASGDIAICSRTVPVKTGGTGTFDSLTACESSPGVPLTCTSNNTPCVGCGGVPA